MILIADCGATTIDWGLISENRTMRFYSSPGINFSLISKHEFYTSLETIIPQNLKDQPVKKIWFYAAGCRTDNQKTAITQSLQSIFPAACVTVESDLLAAARAVCGNTKGIACILGTGSNACLYEPENGGRIIKSVAPLGYILGDEGSGTFIGKRIISDALKGLLSPKLTERFFDFAGADRDDILSRIYTEEKANTYIAEFSKFAKANLQLPEIHNIIYQSFDIFIRRNVLLLQKSESLPIGFVGSIAHSFHHILKKVIDDNRMELSVVLHSPIEALVNYHINYLN